MALSTNSQMGENRAKSVLAGLAIFEKVSNDCVQQFTNASLTRTYPKGTILFLQDDPADYFYVVMSGWVKLFRHTSEGDEAVIDMLTTGAVFGETAILEDNTHSFGAMVTDTATLLSVPTSLLKSSIEKDGQLALSMLSALSKHRIRQTREIEGMTLKNASQRLGCFMLRLCKEADSKDITIKLPYDKSLIAARLGMKPETFSRALNKLRKEIDIDFTGSVVTIPEISKLSDYSCTACSNDFPCDDLK